MTYMKHFGPVTVLLASTALVFMSGDVLQAAPNPFSEATELTQLMNNAELVGIGKLEMEQVGLQVDQLRAQLDLVQGQLKAYQNMIQNTLNLPETVWGDVTGTLTELRTVYSQANTLAMKGAQIDEFLKQGLVDDPLFAESGYSRAAYSERYDDWVDRSQAALEGTLQAGRLTMEDVETEGALVARIQDQGRSVNGQVEAIQVGNELAASMARQMTHLRSITAAQNEATAVYQARLLAERDAEEASKRATMEAAKAMQTEGGMNLFGRFTSRAYEQSR